jgi:hypothetical protein
VAAGKGWAFFFVLFFGSTGVCTQSLKLPRQHSYHLSPFLMMGLFESLTELFAWGWLHSIILLISAS